MIEKPDPVTVLQALADAIRGCGDVLRTTAESIAEVSGLVGSQILVDADEDGQFLDALAATMRTQDEIGTEAGPAHATEYPIYVVRQKARIRGIDPSFSEPDGCEWTVDGDFYEEERDAPEGAECVHYFEYWETVDGAVAFTRQAAEDFIQANSHNLNEPYVWVVSIPRRMVETRRLWDVLSRMGTSEGDKP